MTAGVKHHYTTIWPHTFSNRPICYIFTPSIAEAGIVGLRRRLAWCYSCADIVPMEYLGDIDELMEERQKASARLLRIPVKWIALSGDVDRVPWRSALGW